MGKQENLVLKGISDDSSLRGIIEYSLGLHAAISIICTQLTLKGALDAQALSSAFNECAQSLWPVENSAAVALKSLADVVKAIPEKE